MGGPEGGREEKKGGWGSEGKVKLGGEGGGRWGLMLLFFVAAAALALGASRREGGGEMIAELVSSALGLALYLNTLSADFCYDDR